MRQQGFATAGAAALTIAMAAAGAPPGLAGEVAAASAPVAGATLALAGTAANWSAVGTITHAVGAVGTPFKGDGTGRAVALAALPDATRGRSWTAWVTARDTDWNGAGDERYDARQRSVVGGLGWQVTPSLLVGVLAGREHLRDDLPALPGRLTGGGTALGAYLGWSLLPNLRFDAALVHASMDYDAQFGLAGGALTGRRWVTSTGLTGVASFGGVVVEPSTRFYLGRERQGDVTGTLRYLLTENEMEVGRLSNGGRVAYPIAFDGGSLTPSLGAFAEWRFGQATLIGDGLSFAPANGWSGRVNAALSLAHAGSGVSLTAVVEQMGLGTDTRSWTAQALIGVAF